MSVLTRTFSKFSDDACSTLAAALAYYTVFSLPSILLVVIFVASKVFGQGGAESAIGQAGGPGFGSSISGMAQGAQPNASGGVIASIFAFIGLAFSATTVLLQLQTSLNKVWAVKPDPNAGGWMMFAWKRIYSFGLIVGVGVLLSVSLAFSAIVQSFSTALPLPEFAAVLIESLIWLAITTFLFAAMFKVLPDVQLAFHDVWFGAFITAILFAIGKFLVGFYLSNTHAASGFGPAGSLAVLLLWTYYSALMFLLGAEFTQVWFGKDGRQVQPSKGAVRVFETRQPPEELRPAA